MASNTTKKSKKTAKKAGKKTTKKTAKKKTAKKSSAKKSKKRAAASAKKSAQKRSSREKDPQGGLTAEGRKAFARRDGSHLKPGVTKSSADMSPTDMRRKGN
jgi:Domain of unknown function (DUF6321)